MKFLDFFKTPKKVTTAPTQEKLDENGGLPWGWISRNNNIIRDIENKYNYFLNLWLENKNISPKKHYETLKSFVIYLKEAEEICKLKGECFEFWFYNILITPDYIENRQEELDYIVANFDKLEKIHEERKDLKPKIIKILKENDGIMQSDIKNNFDEALHNEITHILYDMNKSGEIERVKSGRSYKIYYKG